MSRSIELVCALLPEFIHSDTDAEAVLVSARLLGVDPLDYCIHRFGLGADEVMARAAGWAGLAFSPVVPSTVDSSIQLDRIDHLAVARSIRESIYGREVLFIAPRFDGFVNLRSYQAAHPEFRRSTCIAPPAAIRSALARFSAAQLLDEARQRLFRHWPDASAHLDLSRSARLSLVGVTLLLVALSALAPHLLEAAWVVLLGVLLVLPAVFRVLALLPQKNETPLTQAPALADADLPVYSVLIPLRDEAHMVPLLQRAMSALSYPVLWRCYT